MTHLPPYGAPTFFFRSPFILFPLLPFCELSAFSEWPRAGQVFFGLCLSLDWRASYVETSLLFFFFGGLLYPSGGFLCLPDPPPWLKPSALFTTIPDQPFCLACVSEVSSTWQPPPLTWPGLSLFFIMVGRRRLPCGLGTPFWCPKNRWHDSPSDREGYFSFFLSLPTADNSRRGRYFFFSMFPGLPVFRRTLHADFSLWILRNPVPQILTSNLK